MTESFYFIWLSLLVFFFGACVGSFLNVCIYRLPREESVVKPRSHCPHCGALIAGYDNVPLVSWLVLRARCRHCRGAISPRYFLVELLTAALFLLVWLKYGLDGRTPVYWLMIAGLVLGTFIDLEHMIIPDRVTLGGCVAGLVLCPLVPRLQGQLTAWAGFTSALLGLAVGAGLLWLVSVAGRLVFRKDAMGLGDVKLLGGLGALLGWRAVLFIVMVSSLVGAFVGIFLILKRGREWQSRIPYGPYLALAAVLWVLGGREVWNAYLTWLGGVR